MEEKEFYTPSEVAAYFGVTRRTVYAWIKKNELRAVKMGQWKVPRGSLQAFLGRQQQREDTTRRPR